MDRNLRILIFSLLVSCPCGMAYAQSDNEISGNAEAQRLFDLGADHFSMKHFDEAAALFRKAYEASPAWRLWFNIGQAEAASKRYGLALEAFEKYLALGGDNVTPSRLNDVIGEIKQLRELVGKIEVDGAPGGAEIRVDDIVRATIPLEAELRISAGIPHQLEITYNGSIIHSQSVTVGSAGTVTVHVTGGKERMLERPFDGEQSTDSLFAPAARQGNSANLKPLHVVLGTAAGLTVATGGTALAFWIVAGKRNDELQSLNQQYNSGSPNVTVDDLKNKRDEVNKLDNIATALVIGTSVCAAVTIVSSLILIHKRQEMPSALSIGPGSIFVRF